MWWKYPRYRSQDWDLFYNPNRYLSALLQSRGEGKEIDREIEWVLFQERVVCAWNKPVRFFFNVWEKRIRQW